MIGDQDKYKFVDHYSYLCAWMDKMDLPQKVTLVIHDWGSGLGFHWANEHRDRIQGIAFMEALVVVIPSFDIWQNAANSFFRDLRSEKGEQMVIRDNIFIEHYLPSNVIRKLTEEEMTEYRTPFKEEGECRRPTLTFPREIPIGGEPDDVDQIVQNYYIWLSESADIPKLYVHAEPGLFSSGISRIVENWPNLQTTKVKGLHFLQEDSPDDIGQAVQHFIRSIT